MKKLFLLLLIFVLISCKNETNSSPVNTTELHNGDIIFQTSLSSQSQAIQLATKSIYSHCGIIYKDNGAFYVFEAIQPVQKTPLNKWIARGKDNFYIVKRLKEFKDGLPEEKLTLMKTAGETMNGKNYDLYFEWSDDRIYCSELIWKIYKKAGVELSAPEELKDFDLTNPAVKQKLKERYGSNIPLHEKVVSPTALFNSSLLYTVNTN
ncbi:YiiX family permuted papain-like enzyme [Flavobacterium sp. ST-75]|uniref:YiiX family permuted papain-like enzyme n=1 Tax=Flavobacterium rhizophilum TaxID=3163296 RepID=A0ABW8YCI1_9FLAO